MLNISENRYADPDPSQSVNYSLTVFRNTAQAPMMISYWLTVNFCCKFTVSNVVKMWNFSIPKWIYVETKVEVRG